MNKLYIAIFSTFLVFISHFVDGQIKKGDFLIRGALSGYMSNSESQSSGSKSSDESKSIRGRTVTGYFLSDVWVVGLSAHGEWSESSRTSYSNTNSSDGYTIQKRYGAGVFVRKYFPINKKVVFFMDVESTISQLSIKRRRYAQIVSDDMQEIEPINKLKQNYQTIESGLRPGIGYWIHPSIALEFHYGFLGYTFWTGESRSENGQNVSSVSSTKRNTWQIDVSTMHLLLGLSVIL